MKVKTTSICSDGIDHIRRENIASRKRVKRARALGKDSKEFCLAKFMGDASLDFSRVEAPLGFEF
jgi:hypothetical protein